MLQGYTKVRNLSTHLKRRTYLATKQDIKYFIEEYGEMDVADQTRYKVKQMIADQPHVMPLVEHFELDHKDYYVTEFLQKGLSDFMTQHPNNVLPFKEAYRLFKQLLSLVVDCHKEKVIVTELQPQRIMIKGGDIKIYDFSKSQIVKRKRRMFVEFEGSPFTAPEALNEEGYGSQVDVWLCGVLLYYFLTGRFPFTCLNSKEDYLEQILKKCGSGFKLAQNLPNHQYLQPVRQNSFLEHLFGQMFQVDPFNRITIQEINELNPDQDFIKQSAALSSSKALSAICQESPECSVFLSKVGKDSHLAKCFHREEIILDFIQKSSQSFLLDLPKVFNEQLRYRVQSAVLKVGLMKNSQVLEMLYGKRKPDFDTSLKEWQAFRGSSVCENAKKKLQQKFKLLNAYHKSACMNLDPKQPLSTLKIPETFDSFKPVYRKDLSQMYKTGRQQLVLMRQKKQHDEQLRRMMQSVARVIIFYLINRLFEDEGAMKQDFKEYYNWSKSRDLTDLEDWIMSQRTKNLQHFVVKVTSKYLGTK